MGFFDSISSGIKNHFDKNREQREMMDGLQKEADAQRLVAFRDQFAIDAKEVAIAQAKRDAAELSGLQKLRAANRARNLSHGGPEPGTFFEKLSDFTKKNKARMNENIKRTAEIRGIADKDRKDVLSKRIAQRESRLGPRRISTWKM